MDTGASFCIFNRGYAEALGIKVTAGQPVLVGTATSTFDAYRHSLTLTTLGFSFDVMVYFARDVASKRNVRGRRGSG